MNDTKVATELVKSLELDPLFFYVLITAIVLYICIEIFLIGSKLLKKHKELPPFRSEIIWFLVPVIFLVSLLYAL